MEAEFLIKESDTLCNFTFSDDYAELFMRWINSNKNDYYLTITEHEYHRINEMINQFDKLDNEIFEWATDKDIDVNAWRDEVSGLIDDTDPHTYIESTRAAMKSYIIK